MKKIILILCFIPIVLNAQQKRQILNFNADWQFQNQENFISQNVNPLENTFLFNSWETVNLPHTAKVEPLVVIEPWEGISWYKKDFSALSDWKNKKVCIEFEAVMQQAEVWLNGEKIFSHAGGYTPFTVDITKHIDFAKQNRIIVKTDNHVNPDVPPGKPIKTLDFCYFSGIYRNVHLIITNKLHITNAVSENLPASGGIRVWFPEISSQLASIATKIHLRNENNTPQNFTLNYKLLDKKHKTVLLVKSENQIVDADKTIVISKQLNLINPKLWNPEHPYLYKMVVEIIQNNQIIDNLFFNIGIRNFEVKDDRLFINNKPLLLVGTNRHQEYPYIGNALSDNAQYRDAVKIKEAGFNIVRLSHYPQSNAFMDACDELGILTIDAIPGWQFVGDEIFMNNSYQDARDLIHRDRNHASVVFWELSLNESDMPDSFMKKMVEIAKEESPETKLITCGWKNKYYDVWIPARQHAKFPDYWKNYTGKTPLFTGEYGDWEYFAQDAGLYQANYAGLKSNERTSRQLRGDGEKRMIKQATNFQEAHNDNLHSPHLGDANWLMYDYNRGYSPDIESSGIMDIFRIPKFSYYFYRSQSEFPVLKIASYWNKNSDFKNIHVYSNCDEVELYLNNHLIGKQSVKRETISDMLPHPPFIFHLNNFESGELKAVGYKNNKVILQDKINTQKEVKTIKISFDLSSKKLKADGSDAIFIYATLFDENGSIVTESDAFVQFSTSNNAKLIGQNPVKTDAGIATILLQTKKSLSEIKVSCTSEHLKSYPIFIKPKK